MNFFFFPQAATEKRGAEQSLEKKTKTTADNKPTKQADTRAAEENRATTDKSGAKQSLEKKTKKNAGQKHTKQAAAKNKVTKGAAKA